MRITQGTFSYLPDLTDKQIGAQIQFGIDNSWAVSIEYTDDPHPRNIYWDMWGLPMFDIADASAGLMEVNRCRKAQPDAYIRVSLYNPKLTKQTTAVQFLVHRPADEPGFRIDRQEVADRQIHYSLSPYSTQRPSGSGDDSMGAKPD